MDISGAPCKSCFQSPPSSSTLEEVVYEEDIYEALQEEEELAEEVKNFTGLEYLYAVSPRGFENGSDEAEEELYLQAL